MTRIAYYMLYVKGDLWGNNRPTQESDTRPRELNKIPECVLSAASYCSFIHIPFRCGQTRCWHRGVNRANQPQNGEAFPEGNTANCLIVQMSCSFTGSSRGKYSTTAANKPVHNAEARPALSHCNPPQTHPFVEA